MKADKREIVTFVIAALATLVAVWFFLGKMQKEKDTVRTDLYTLVAPASDAILSVNRPAAFTKYILSRDSERDAFASKIPDIYLSIIQNNRNIPWLLLSFHPQGVILYAQAGNNLVGRIEKNTLQKAFGSFAPQKQKRDGITFTYYPDTGNRFFGYYQHEGIWVASFVGFGRLFQQETTRRSRPNPTKPAKLPATRPRSSAQVIRQKRPVEPDGTIGQSRPLCFPPRFNRMGYPKRLVRRRSFHE